MTKVDLQYDLVNYTPASASPVQANFSRTEQHINQELIERDGTVAMRAQLKLVGDPVAELDAAPKQYVDAVLPVGIIMMYGGAAAPPGGRWAICNGAELETATWPELFAVIGNTYSLAGVPAGRFNLPNLTDRFARGGTPGAQGGTKDAVVVPHTHDNSHGHADSWASSINLDHLHGSGSLSTVGANARHVHQQWPIQVYQHTGAPTFYLMVDSGGILPTTLRDLSEFNTQADSPDHGHAMQGATGGMDRSSVHNHLTNTPAYSGNTGGASGAVSGTDANLPPYLGVTHIIRAK